MCRRPRSPCPSSMASICISGHGAVGTRQLPRTTCDSSRCGPILGTAVGRAILNRRAIHIRDVDQDSGITQAVRTMGVRSTVAIPLLRGEQAIGVIAVASPTTGGFADPQVELLGVFAEQAVIAITSAETYRALQERTVALAQRNTEYGERIEHQAATIDVLKAMSASPGDPQPVFDLIVERARDLCGALWRVRVRIRRHGASSGAPSTGVSDDPAVRAAYEAQFPMAPTREVAVGASDPGPSDHPHRRFARRNRD